MVKSRFCKFFIFFIIFSFILTGIGNYIFYIFADFDNYIVQVNKKKINFSMLEEEIKKYRFLHNKIVKDNQENNFFNNYKLYRRVLLNLIDKSLLLEYAKELGLVVSDQQVREKILSTSHFLFHKKFSNKRFNFFVRNVLGITPKKYADFVRDELIIQQIIYGIDCGNFMFPIEMQWFFPIMFQFRKVRLAKFDIEKVMQKQNITESDVRCHYELYKNQYVFPRMFKIGYFLVDINLMENFYVPNFHEISDWYVKNIHKFYIPACKRYSVIYTDKKNKAFSYLRKIQSGRNFHELAKLVSIDADSSKNGGDIGWINDNDIFLDEIKKADLKKLNEISSIIKCSKGFAIVKLDHIQSKKIIPLHKVEKYISSEIKKVKSCEYYYTLKKKIINILQNNVDNFAILQKLQKLYDVNIEETNWFSVKNVPKSLDYIEIKDFLFRELSLDLNESFIKKFRLIDIDNDCFCFFYIIDYKNESIQPIEKVYHEIEYFIRRKQAVEKTRILAENVVKKLNTNRIDESNVLCDYNLQFNTFRVFSFFSFHDALTRKVFSLSLQYINKSSYGVFFSECGDVLLIALDDVYYEIPKNSQDVLFIKKLSLIISNHIMLDTLLCYLRNRADIKINTNLFYNE
ncbi:MAG: periplasmic folding chaperone [Candidatus Westeberhardia cardiocondylae]|nr:periplasmic folding chaperone [Candidatus Westeberhardia cardiocondylae]